MTRYHATPEGKVAFTAEEETARDAEEKAEMMATPMKTALRNHPDAIAFTSIVPVVTKEEIGFIYK